MGSLETNLKLDRFALYWRREVALRWAARGLICGLGVALAVELAARTLPILTLWPRLALSLSIPALAMLVALLAAYLVPRSPLELARISDARMGLYARLATAIEIGGGRIAIPAEMAERQRADAVAAAQEADPGRAFKLMFPRGQAAVAAVMLTTLAIGLALPNPQERVIASSAREQAQIAQQVERLEKVRQEIAANPDLSPEDKEALLNEIDDTIRDLEEGALSREEAVARLSETEERLRALLDEGTDAMEEAMEEAGREAAGAGSLREVGEALAQGDYESAAEAMETLSGEVGEMSPQERAALAERLEAMADAVEAQGARELAQAWRDAAAALREGDIAAAQEALQRAAALTEQAGERIAAQRATEQALGQVQEGRREIAQSGEGEQGQQGQGQGQQGDQGQGQSGSGNGDSDGPDGQGPPADPGGPIEPNQPGEDPADTERPGEKRYDPIYAPERLGEGGGEQVEVPGQGDGGGPPTGEVDGGPHDDGQALVPYDEVYADYQAQAASALENSYIPRGMKDYVRAYFSSLEPER